MNPHPQIIQPPTTWFVLVKLLSPLDERIVHRYAMGPLGSWSRARKIAARWEMIHGEGTAGTTERLPGRPAA